MTGIRLNLADPADFLSPHDYIEQHLLPIAAELHRLTNELIAPGSTAEEIAVDMAPSSPGASFADLDRRLDESSKHVTFDGAEYFTIPKDVLVAKQAKVQLTAVVYLRHLQATCGAVEFRLVRDDGMLVENSTFEVTNKEPEMVTRILPFGYQDGSISPERREYVIQARYVGERTLPVCRRFSLSFVYI
jgi:hypothetical protein